jgi:hypothetical protein
MGRQEKETREGFERWLDERIHAAISNLASPFEKRIDGMRRRVEGLRVRFQHLSRRVDSLQKITAGSRRSPKSKGGAPR